MATRTKRRTNTSLVINPARSLSIGGARKNPVRKRRRAAVTHKRRRRNPVRKVVAMRRNPSVRRRSNPTSVTGLVSIAIMAGIGVSFFDVITSRFVPQSSALVRAGVKLGGAWLFQSNLGNKVPVLAKYRHEIALVLAVAGVTDLMKLYVMPLIAPFASSIGLYPSQMQQIDDGSLGNIYGNAIAPTYQPYS
jgi:hypothetical protein